MFYPAKAFGLHLISKRYGYSIAFQSKEESGYHINSHAQLGKNFIKRYHFFKPACLPNFGLFFNYKTKYTYVTDRYFQEIKYFHMDSKKLTEILRIFNKIPLNLHMSITAGYNHAARVIFGNPTVFYESNEAHEFSTFEDICKLVTCIQRNPFRRIGHDDEKMLMSFTIFEVLPKNTASRESFNYFGGSRLPKTKEDWERMIRQSANKFTPSQMAVITNSLDDMRFLMQKSFTDIRKKDYVEKDTVDWAIENGRIECLKIMMAYADKNDKTFIIEKIIRKGNLELLKPFLKAEFINENFVMEGEPVFIYLINRSWWPIVKYCIAHNYGLNIPDSNGVMPIFKALKEDSNGMFSKYFSRKLAISVN